MNTAPFRRILIPTDLSDIGRAATRWALMLQKHLGSELVLLHASEPYIPIDVDPITGFSAYNLQQGPGVRERIEAELRKFADDHLPGVDVKTIVAEEAPLRAIVETARDLGSDLILMSTHGRTGWRRALMGSVTERVVHRAGCAVLSVPAMDALREPKVRKILCPVNFTPVGTQALERATELARTFDAELLVVHVAEPLQEPLLDVLREDLKTWIEPAVRNRCRITQIVLDGETAERVILMAREAHVDLIVIGAQHRWFADDTVIGTTTERVVRFASCPVLTVVAQPVGARLASAKREEVVSA